MKKWSEIKEQIECIDGWDCSNTEIVDALQALFEWLDNYFYGEWRLRNPNYNREHRRKKKLANRSKN